MRILQRSINDFNRQALLVSELSNQGPCLYKNDLNKDGLDDILIGGGAGQATSCFHAAKKWLICPKENSSN